MEYFFENHLKLFRAERKLGLGKRPGVKKKRVISGVHLPGRNGAAKNEKKYYLRRGDL